MASRSCLRRIGRTEGRRVSAQKLDFVFFSTLALGTTGAIRRWRDWKSSCRSRNGSVEMVDMTTKWCGRHFSASLVTLSSSGFTRFCRC
ncbi:unnamed protein product [Protopolystoma xenopodis]|uniref:Uncharacterized protein n=1 Tax=Protopolystoma xenopodis TaxID=117903 RepID=A0A3S5AYX5_9PLAT|nr:unnamed protein product [Protopolystoma xenopodis]